MRYLLTVYGTEYNKIDNTGSQYLNSIVFPPNSKCLTGNYFNIMSLGVSYVHITYKKSLFVSQYYIRET